MTQPAPRSSPRWVRTGAGLALALVAVLVAIDATVRIQPRLLPAWYRERFPMHGVELFHPGILAETPITGLPLPLVVEPHTGPPPADLKELGLVPVDVDADARRYPEIHLPSDALGLPNPVRRERAEILLVGDSFGVAAGVERPPGLRALLEERTGRTVYDLSVAAIGPVREEWLLENVGFAMEPRCVVWLFFSGNDATLSIEPLIHEHRGAKTWADVYADRRPPLWRLGDLLQAWVNRPSHGEQEDRLTAGFTFTLDDGSEQALWFHPDNLRQLSLGTDRWEADLGWRNAQEVLRRVAGRCAERNVALLLVYVPSKAEVYLPYVESDAPQALETAGMLWPEPIELGTDAFLSELFANRTALEQLFLGFCEAEGLAHLSARPYLEALAQRGGLGYLVADSHWQEEGQTTLLEPLTAALEDL